MRLIDPTKEKFEFKKSSSQFDITKENFNKGLCLLFVRNAANRVYCLEVVFNILQLAFVYCFKSIKVWSIFKKLN